MNRQDVRNLLTASREWLRWNWKKVVLIVVAVFIAGVLTGRARAAEPTPTVSLTYQVGAENVVTLTWSAPWAASCNASGAWSGTKSPTGTQTLPSLTQTRTFGLACVAAVDNTARLSWEAPTQYTDGTPLAAGDLAAYRVFRGASTSNMARIAEIPASQREYLDAQLPTGTHHYTVSAVSVAGIEGARAEPRNKVVTVPQQASASVTLRVPGAPVLTVQVPVAFDVRMDGLRFQVAREVGSVPVGTVCHKDFELPDGFYRVEREAVQFSRTPGSAVIVARCG